MVRQHFTKGDPDQKGNLLCGYFRDRSLEQLPHRMYVYIDIHLYTYLSVCMYIDIYIEGVNWEMEGTVWGPKIKPKIPQTCTGPKLGPVKDLRSLSLRCGIHGFTLLGSLSSRIHGL